MKKIAIYLMATCLTLTLYPLQTNAATTPTTLTTPTKNDEMLANTLLERLNEINEMDKSDLKSSEKRVLRKEVRSIKHQLKNVGGGVYISVGAIIIILLLLIILL